MSERQAVDGADVYDVNLALTDIKTIVMDFNCDYGDELPIIVQSAIKVLDKAIIDLRTILEAVTDD